MEDVFGRRELFLFSTRKVGNFLNFWSSFRFVVSVGIEEDSDENVDFLMLLKESFHLSMFGGCGLREDR